MSFRLLIAALALFAVTNSTFAAEVRMMDTGWRFLRGNPPGAEQPAFNDAAWRSLDLPHDWSIEDLPPRESDPLFKTLPLVPGTWRFSFAGSPTVMMSDLNDQTWKDIILPDDAGSLVTGTNPLVWLRRSFTVPVLNPGQTVLLDLGIINGQDVVYVDGRKLQENDSKGYWSTVSIQPRIVPLPAEYAVPGEHVVAVEVRPLAGAPHLFTSTPSPPQDASPFDPGRSLGSFNTGFTVGGTGWYRRKFQLSKADEGRTVRIFFEGSAVETTVWLNGQEIGRNSYAYSPFCFDLTPHLRPAGQENVLAVKVENAGSNSRWYAGSGLFRAVRLELTDPVAIAPWGLAITSAQATAERATVVVDVETVGASEGTTLGVEVFDPTGHLVATGEQVTSGSAQRASLELDISKPQLWSPETPHLYHAEITLRDRDRVRDRQTRRFGIRTLTGNAHDGLSLNGKPLELRGGCLHHDHGPLGAASFPAAEERRVRLLKAAGYNALRTSHNPVDPAFLDACDRLGMLVIEEAFDMWNLPKNANDYSKHFGADHQRDLAAMIRRDRVHPSIIAWSIGNEIPEQHSAAGAKTARELAALARELDPSRPVAQAVNGSTDATDPTFAAVDWAGYNYRPERFAQDHARHPERFIVTTESYPKDSFDYWREVESKPYVFGDFVWTAWDYLGETAIGHTLASGEQGRYLRGWPNTNAYCGDFDLVGSPKPQSFYRQVLWNVRPIAIAVDENPPGHETMPDKWGWRDEQSHWNWTPGSSKTVRVYGQGDTAVLLLNGKEVGRGPVAPDHVATFTITHAPGVLEARLLKGGKLIAQDQLVTTKAASALRLRPEQPAWPAQSDSVAFVWVEAVDSDGRVVPTAENEVTITITGPGRLQGFGNGDPRNTSSVQTPRHQLWRGRALVVVRSDGRAGNVKISARAGGLADAQVDVSFHAPLRLSPATL